MLRAGSSVVGVMVLLGGLGVVACGDDGRRNRAARTAARPPATRLPRTKELPNAEGVDPELKKQLDRVAGCFRRAVPVLRSEPAAGELGRFLQRATKSAKLQKACGGLRFGKGLGGKVLVQASGCPVRFARLVVGEDFYGGGRTVMHVRYRFRCEGKRARAEVMILHGIGKRP